MPKYARKRSTYTPKKRYYSKKRPATPKKATTYARKRTTKFSRKRTYKSGSGSYAKQMQDNTFQYVKKKYTQVFPIKVGANADSTAVTISIMGGRNATTPNECITIGQVDPDGLLSNDMEQHQHFKITGMQSKLFWPEGTTPDSTPVQWSMAYSGSQVINPAVGFGPIQTLSTFQSSSCDSARPITRYFVPNAQLQRLGVDWCQTNEVTNGNFNNQNPVPLYGGQLPVNSGSSLYLKATRATTGAAVQIGRLQVTYYITYRGVIGNNAII